MKTFILTCLGAILLSFSSVFAQEGTLSGRVVDASSGNPLIGANVVLNNTANNSDTQGATITDQSGFFEFPEVSYGDYTVVVTYVGFSPYRKVVSMNQSSMELEIALEEREIDLGEVIVSSLHQPRQVKHVSMPIEVMNSSEIEEIVAMTPADALRSEPGLELKDDGTWATSLNIRGLNEQRIVSLVDGNRIETATDLAAALSMIDISEIARIEVIKGAASSIYGTGAMGGVVNFITKKAHFSDDPYFNGELMSEFQSVNGLFSQKLAFNGGNDFGYFRISGRMRNAGDITTPRGVLPNSQFKDHNLAADIGLKPFENHLLELQVQRFLAEDVGIPGGAPFPGPAEATYTKAERNLISARYTIQNISPAWEKLSVKYFRQHIIRNVLMYPNIPAQQSGNVLTQPQRFTPSGKHYTQGFEVKSHWTLGEKHRLTGGVDLWQRKLETSREKFIQQEVYASDSLLNPIDTVNLVRGETPIPESQYASGGIFFQDEFTLFSEALQVTIDGRYDLIRVSNEKAVDPEYLIRNDTPLEPVPNQRITFPEKEVINKSWSTNLGLLVHAAEEVDFTFTLGRSFRSPSLEERYKYIDLGDKVRVGDPELEPENGVSFDAGFRLWKPNLSLQANVFLNQFSNLIVEQNGEFIYKYSTGAGKGTTDTLPALVNMNVDESRLYGFDMQLKFILTDRILFHGNASYVSGRDTKNDEYLPLIPPLNGRLGLKYRIPGILAVDVTSILYDEQDKTPEGEDKTDGYTLFDLSMQSEPIDIGYGNIRFYGGVKNIFDTAYRNHLSSNRGILNYQPGRNFYLKMNIQF